VNDQGLIKLGRRHASAPAAGIELPFLEFSLESLIVGDAPFLGAPLAMDLATSKRTIDIVSAGIAGVGQKKNVAAPASLQAGPKTGMLSHHRPQLPKVLSSYLPNAAFLIPVCLKLKKGLKSDGKKAKS
jgi:hypothetical protein